jgi:hypothetical protein
MAQQNTTVVTKNPGDQFTSAELNNITTTINANATDTQTRVSTLEGASASQEQRLFDQIIVVKEAADLAGTLSSTVIYFIDGIIDMGSQSIEVPAGGLSLAGHNFDVSQLISSQAAYTMFTSPVGGSGNFVCKDLGITTSGAGSQVFNITDVTGFNAIEMARVNFNNCSSLGTITDYRQGLEDGNGRFGGTPELTLAGSWSGWRATTCIVRGMNNITSLFKTGVGLSFSGRFITDMNCDLPAVGAFIDFANTAFVNDESLVLSGTYITRQGVINASDTTIYPNIDHTDVQSRWSDNTGLPNTNKYLEARCTTEAVTTVSAVNTYYVAAGTYTVNTATQFDMPANGEYRLLTGNGSYFITGDFSVDGPSNAEVDIRVTKSTDGGVTWPTEINHMKRIVNNLSGGRDVAFFAISFVAELNKNDRVRIELENKSNTGNLTVEEDSYFIITEV